MSLAVKYWHVLQQNSSQGGSYSRGPVIWDQGNHVTPLTEKELRSGDPKHL